MHPESFNNYQELVPIRNGIQVELMKKFGVSDSNYSLWRDNHYAEDFALAFDQVVEENPNLQEKYTAHAEDIIADIENLLKRIHSYREEVKSQLIQQSIGVAMAVPKDFYDTWLQKYDSLYNEAFDAFMKEQSSAFPSIEVAISRIQKNIDDLIEHYHEKNRV